MSEIFSVRDQSWTNQSIPLPFVKTDSSKGQTNHLCSHHAEELSKASSLCRSSMLLLCMSVALTRC